MTKRLSKKEIEAHYFERFRQYYALPLGTITHGDRPDFILQGEKKIGIETTNFYLENGGLPESEQCQRKFRKEILVNAQNMYQSKNTEKIELSVGFNKKIPIGNKNDIIHKLVVLAEQIKEYETGEIDANLFRHIPEVINLYADKFATPPRWRTIQGYTGSIMSRERLIKIIKDKEALSNNYQKCDSYWLLVIIDAIDRAQDQEIQIDNFKKIKSDVFEKIIIYKTHFDHVLDAK